MQIIRLIILLTLISTNLSMAQKSLKLNNISTEFKALKYKFHLESLIPGTKEIYKIDDHINLYYFKEMTLCQLPVYSGKSTEVSANETTVKNNVELTDSISHYNSLIWKNGSSKALFYQSGAEPKEIELAPQLAKMFFFKDEMFMGEDLAFINKTEENGFVLEKYFSRTKNDSSFNDSTHLYFDKNFNGPDFSISKAVDEKKKMKLIKAVFIYNPHFDKTLQQTIPPREISVQIENFIVTGKEKIIDLFERASLILP